MNSNSDFSNPRCVADHLGLGTLADDEPTAEPELLRAVYRHARNEDGKRVLFENDKTFARGWINLNTPEAVRLISAFVPQDDETDVKHARNTAAANLEAQPWNDVLGIERPPIKIAVKVHGQKWGLRFQSGEPAMKGMEKINEELPPIPSQKPTSEPASPSSPPAPTPQPVPDASASPCSAAVAPSYPASPQSAPDSEASASSAAIAADALKSAGMPS